jgi:hypothetical protein
VLVPVRWLAVSVIVRERAVGADQRGGNVEGGNELEILMAW